MKKSIRVKVLSGNICLPYRIEYNNKIMCLYLKPTEDFTTENIESTHILEWRGGEGGYDIVKNLFRDRSGTT